MLASLSPRRGLLSAALTVATVASAFLAAPALGAPPPRAVYTMTNNTAANAIVVFERHKDGSLSQREVVLTGGKGADNQPPFGFPVVDSSESMRLSRDGGLLFAVNGGSNTVSAFRVTRSGLKLVDQARSGGALPISLDIHGNLLYVLNEGSGDISGLYVDDDGEMTPIPNSTQKLSSFTGDGVNGAPAQISFAPGGRVLNVSERGTNTIDTFTLGDDNTPGPAVPTTTPAGANNPFGFAYQGRDHVIVTNADASDPAGMFTHSSVSSYELDPDSTPPLTPISPLVFSGGAASCWVALSNDQRYAFVSNTGSGAGGDVAHDLSIFRVADDGSLTLLGHAGPPGNTGFTSDLGLSYDGRYLYVIQPSNVINPFSAGQAPAPNTSHVDEFAVGSGGTLTYIGSTPSDLPNSLSGIAVW